MTAAMSITALRQKIAKLADGRRDEYLGALEAALAMPAGDGRTKALARLSARTLRAEALDSRPRMVRAA